MAGLQVNCRLYGTVMSRNGGIQKNLKSNTQSADSNLIPRYEGSGKTKDLPTLANGDEGRNEIQIHPCGGRGLWYQRLKADQPSWGLDNHRRLFSSIARNRQHFNEISRLYNRALNAHAGATGTTLERSKTSLSLITDGVFHLLKLKVTIGVQELLSGKLNPT
ncbi:hypothetical protein AVEN_254342-1 [Araneus ventricosus]|uniref:Uncharacterized protein n=1 Tax=Araneus ventricosus TaxID=182803 RepID=A0A4Y2LZS4_ARAVE|nr:hypothetical protein AVEN_254342-1 [Araneus ventricosus]